MSLRLTFRIIAPRAEAEALVRAVCEHLVDADRDRLLAGLANGADRVMREVRRDDHEMPPAASLCLSFLFPADSHLLAFASDADEPSAGAAATGRIAVGCVWSDLYLGERYVSFTATAATAGMSELFNDSPAVRAAFVDMARQVHGAAVGLEDDIWNTWAELWRAPGAQAYAEAIGMLADSAAIAPTDRECLALLLNRPG